MVTRKLYSELGGFPDQVLLEDVEFLRKARAKSKSNFGYLFLDLKYIINAAKIEAFPMVLSVSARKFEQRGALL